MSRLRHLAERVAKDATRWIGARWGESFPFYYVSEFPKSGGTWMARMVSDYLQLPFPQWTIFPVGFRAVLQNHWMYDPRFRRVFYVHRDGRDVITSFFFDRVRVARHSNRPARDRMKRRFDSLLGADYDPNDTLGLMPKFMEFEFTDPKQSRKSWRRHIESWYDPDNRSHIAYLSYEQLLEDCASTLGGAIEKLSGEPIDQWRLETTIEKFSMSRQTGRKRGHEDVTQHIRKGVAGDWLNHFSREAAEMFNDFAGDTLVMLGYEKDKNWVDRYEYQTS